MTTVIVRARGRGEAEFSPRETQTVTFVIVGEDIVRNRSLSLYDIAHNHERHVHASACSPHADAAPFDLRSIVEAGIAALPLPKRIERTRASAPLHPKAVANFHAGERIFRRPAGMRLPIDDRGGDVLVQVNHGSLRSAVTRVNIVTNNPFTRSAAQ